MRPNPIEGGQRWLLQSRRDPGDAQYARDGNRHNLACFLSQQAAEKALNAFLYAHGRLLVTGHSVARLCRDAEEYAPDFRSLYARAAPLDKYYIPTRYPNGLPGGIPADAFDATDADRALSLAKDVIAFVATRFPKMEEASDDRAEDPAGDLCR